MKSKSVIFKNHFFNVFHCHNMQKHYENAYNIDMIEIQNITSKN